MDVDVDVENSRMESGNERTKKEGRRAASQIEVEQEESVESGLPKELQDTENDVVDVAET